MDIPLLTAVYNKIFKKPDAAQSDTDPVSYVYAAINDIMSMWRVTDDRRTIYLDIKRMCDDDEYAAAALDLVSRDTLKLTDYEQTVITVTHDDENVKRAVEGILARSGLDVNAKVHIADLFQYNNSYAEFIIDPATKKFHRTQWIPEAWSVYRNIDLHGALLNDDPAFKKIKFCAYDQRDDNGGFLAGFWPYQIVHFKGAPWDKEGYGIPSLRSARKNWLRLQYIEDAAAFARIVRAYLKLVHKVPVAREATEKDIRTAIKRYKQNLQGVQLNSVSGAFLNRHNSAMPYKVDTDFFMPHSEVLDGDIKALDPQNAQLQNIEDIKYDLNRLFAALKAPKARMANEEDVRAKATMVEINSVYGSYLVGVQQDYLGGCKQVVDNALILEGIDPAKFKQPYKLSLPSPFIKSESERAEIESKESITAGNMVKGKIMSRFTALKTYLGYDDQQAADELERVKQEMLDFPDAPAFGMESQKTEENIIRTLYTISERLDRMESHV